MNKPLIIIGLASVVLFAGAVWYSQTVSSKANEGVTTDVHVTGNPDAAVLLEEFSDFQCPACASFHPVVKDVLENYGDQIRFEYKHFPLITIHRNAESAARAAEAAGQQGKFFEFHDKLFENQSQWSSSVNPSAYFDQYAEELGLDMETFKAQQKSSVIRDHIRAQMSEGRERDITSTPTFFLNGQKVEMQTLGDLRLAVEEVLGIKPEAASSTEPGSAETTPESSTQAGPDVRFGL